MTYVGRIGEIGPKPTTDKLVPDSWPLLFKELPPPGNTPEGLDTPRPTYQPIAAAIAVKITKGGGGVIGL